MTSGLRNWLDAAMRDASVRQPGGSTWQIQNDAQRMSGGGGQTGSGPRVVPTPDPVPYAGDVPAAAAEDASERDRKLWAAIGRGGRRAGPGVVWEGDRR